MLSLQGHFFHWLNKFVSVSFAHLAAVKAVNWTVVWNKQCGWRMLKKRRVSSNQAPELFVCCVKAIRLTAEWWKSWVETMRSRRAKMSEVFNAALIQKGEWKMTTSSASKMLSPNLNVWRQTSQSSHLSGLNMKDISCVCQCWVGFCLLCTKASLFCAEQRAAPILGATCPVVSLSPSRPEASQDELLDKLFPLLVEYREE